MLFTIRHRTRYDYSQPVRLSPQQLRFYPRCDGSQRVVAHQLNISPAPQGQNEHLDLEGNRVTQVWFEGETRHFQIEVDMQVETLRHNAFDFMLAPQSMLLPINHEQDSICARAYLERSCADDAVTVFAAELSLGVNRDTLRFLDRLNRQLHADFSQVHRHSGPPQAPAFTLQTRHGACRDLAVLFVDCCRAEGIAARFASGYQKGNLQSDRRDLHAWPEVYLPGAGWRGFDPTHGYPVADTHVTIAAAAHARDTLPVSGVFIGGGAHSRLDFEVQIQVSGP
ncbi:transglutaminase [Marinobacterium nitratireducens]|uniref:Transglutaminase n=1 Tax=Marinobacterium nitratireducens TaxID=518897 RepID=A0A917ZFA7_9GAMM|nr:transglutaminase family protein [Marinobacterium nitratireducens]GGO81788.1 transglutaminase [Marinobacterium nitratireducens]